MFGINHEPWREEAACRYTDPDLFFPESGAGMHTTAKAAKAVCAVCPVRNNCLDDALRNDERHGIFGGINFGAAKSTVVRERLRRERNIPAPAPEFRSDHGTDAGAAAHRRRGEKPCAACLAAATIAKRERERRSRAV